MILLIFNEPKMKFKHIIQSNSNNLILFFCGFGFNSELFTHIKSNNNVVFIYDYSDFKYDFIYTLNKYKNIYLIAWSMGVAISSRMDLNGLNIVYKTAINGTPVGIDEIKGIRPRIFKHTIKSFNNHQFLNSCFDKCITIDNIKPQIELKNELENIMKICQLPVLDTKFNLVLSSKNDNIFPRSAILNSFNKEIIKTVEKPHFCFQDILFWEELCTM